jgi:hypothetical protein
MLQRNLGLVTFPLFLISMNILKFVLVIVVGIGYIAIGWFVLKYRPMQDNIFDSVLGYGAILYGAFRLIRGLFIPKQQEG